MSSSILRDWAAGLPLRHQGTLLACVRGCDGASKNDVSKPIIRGLRYAFLNPADEREVSKPGAYMARIWTSVQMRAFVGDMDGFPLHFVTHLMNAAEVVAYKHPDLETRDMALLLYRTMAHKLHLHPENEALMDARLTATRIAGGVLIEPDYAGAVE